MKWSTILTQLPERPEFFGQMLSIGKDSGDLHWNDVMSFAGTGTRVDPLEHRYLWAYQDPYQWFIADQVCPGLPMSALDTKIRYINESTFYNEPDDNIKSTRTGEPAKIKFGTSVADFSLYGYALAAEVSRVDKIQAISQYGSERQYRAVVIELLKRLIMLKRERLVATLYQTSSNYATGYSGTLGSSYWSLRKKWNASEGNLAKPYQDIEIATQGWYADLNGATQANCLPLMAPYNTLIMGQNVSYNLRNNCTDLISAVTVTSQIRAKGKPAVKEDAMSSYFDVSTIVGRAKYNSTPEDTSTFTPGNIWADYVIMTSIGNNVGGASLTPSFANTIYYQGTDLPNYKGWMVKSVNNELTGGGMGGEIIVVAYWADEVIISQKAGWLLKPI